MQLLESPSPLPPITDTHQSKSLLSSLLKSGQDRKANGQGDVRSVPFPLNRLMFQDLGLRAMAEPQLPTWATVMPR